jgi:hypothetical protein
MAFSTCGVVAGTAAATTCGTRSQVVEALVPIRSAEADMARDDLPASIASSAVIRPKDLVAKSAERTYEQVAESLADHRFSDRVLHVGTP